MILLSQKKNNDKIEDVTINDQYRRSP